MKRAVFGGVALAALMMTVSAPSRADDLAVWRDFLKQLKSGGMADTSRYRTFDRAQRAAFMGMLEQARGMIVWDSCPAAPEVFRHGDEVRFLAPLVFHQGGQSERADFCFSFLVTGGRWYFEQLESIVLRLDRLGPPPVSAFPDLPEETKAWMRDELQTSMDISHYVSLAREKGADAARSWFLDGVGYALAARSWTPFVPPERAFVLYLCWEQANLRGQKVTLEALDEAAARVRIASRYFELYRRATHLRPQISEADYRALFEAIWRDRAANAGWDVAFAYEGDDCVFRFTRAAKR